MISSIYEISKRIRQAKTPGVYFIPYGHGVRPIESVLGGVGSRIFGVLLDCNYARGRLRLYLAALKISGVRMVLLLISAFSNKNRNQPFPGCAVLDLARLRNHVVQ